MRCSIFHLFAHLAANSHRLKTVSALTSYPFPTGMLACLNKGTWPDLAIRINPGDTVFTGGELVELKDAKSFAISSFNSTIPTGIKPIGPLIAGASNQMRAQMEAAGNDIDSLPVRDVYYLVRGRRRNRTRVCLVHGSFFETVPPDRLVQEAFRQMVEERIAEEELSISPDVVAQVVSLFSERDTFSRVRHVPGASVRLRFRVMTEVAPEGNILQYDGIGDDTLTFVAPNDSRAAQAMLSDRLWIAFEEAGAPASHHGLSVVNIIHRLNGPFLGYQTAL